MNEPKRPHLPPMFDGVKDGSVAWKRIAEIDHELLGYFLTCHLLIEHYLDEYLKATIPQLDWEKPRLTFGQRINLVTWEVLVSDQKYDPIPAIKHLNALRNKISHRLEIKLDMEALQPLADYLQKLSSSRPYVAPSDPKELLEAFVGTCCATFASHLSFQYRQYPNS
ncbi:hypothetical protein [Hydrogenophaga sp.]|uniref:hypothetical protein n=1 Tax=Hydrogenophaga sp. TaxID=1904254 RepID=UPI0025C5EE37|nr:hypothetical protein [Hydrogenophaga sp.]MBT9465541.1 hypothetical protein [Hydrogenophaga sp.]